MQVSWSPTARWTRVAATALSTPPDSAQITRPSPTSAADRADGRFHVVRGRPVTAGTGDAQREVGQDVPPAGGVDHLGVELEPHQAVVVGHGRERRRRAGGDDPEPGRRLEDAVAVAHPDRRVIGDAGEERLADRRLTVAGPNSRRSAGATSAAQLVGHELHAVADAQDRDVAAPQARVGLRRVLRRRPMPARRTG